MSKRITYTEISPLPPNVTRELVLDFLHNHVEMIDLNPLIKERHPIPVPADAPADERHLAWYSLTDEISYLPGGMATGDVSYTAAFRDMPNGIQTHCRAPLGVDIRSRWTLNGTLPGEAPEATELGIGAPAKGLYIREDVELRCNVFVASFVKKTTKRAHLALVEHLARKAGKAAADLAAASGASSPALLTAASPPTSTTASASASAAAVRSHRGVSLGSYNDGAAQGYVPQRYSPRPSSLNPSAHGSGCHTAVAAAAATGRPHAHSLSESTANAAAYRPLPTSHASYHPAQRRYSPKILTTPQLSHQSNDGSSSSDVPMLFRPPQAPLGSPTINGQVHQQQHQQRSSLDNSSNVPALFRPPQALNRVSVGGRPYSASLGCSSGQPDVPALFRPPQAPLPSPPVSGGWPSPSQGSNYGGGSSSNNNDSNSDIPALFRPPHSPLNSPPLTGGSKYRSYSPPPPTYTPNLMMAPSACSAGNTPAMAVPPSPASSIEVDGLTKTAARSGSSDNLGGLALRTDTGGNPFPNPLRISKSNSNASSVYHAGGSVCRGPRNQHQLDSPVSSRPTSGGFFYPEMNPYEFNDGEGDGGDSISAAVDRVARELAESSSPSSFTSSVASTPTSAVQPPFAELPGSEVKPGAGSPRLMMFRNSQQYDAHPMALRPGASGTPPAGSPLAFDARF